MGGGDLIRGSGGCSTHGAWNWCAKVTGSTGSFLEWNFRRGWADQVSGDRIQVEFS